MKRFAFALPLLLLSSSALAQQRPAAIRAAVDPSEVTPAPAPAADTPETLVGAHGFVQHNGWYVAPSLGTTSIGGRFGATGGLRGAWLINRQFGIGLAGTGFEVPATSGNSDMRIDGGYGGLLLQYIIGSDRLVHGFVDTTIGGGTVCPAAPAGGRSDCTTKMASFFLIEPTANVEINVASFMRVDVGAGYRFAMAGNGDTLSNGDLGGFVARTNFVFGQF